MTTEADPRINFIHRQTAHCESGVIAGLLSHSQVELTESLAFGIGGALFFGFFPFVKVGGQPLATFRRAPGSIINKVSARVGVSVRYERFRDPHRAMAALDQVLATGRPVGLQTSVYWLPYFPPALRFHFNAHNLVVYGRRGDDYLISDPVVDEPVVCPRADLLKARFAKGVFSPRGTMYYVTDVRPGASKADAALRGIRDVCRAMTAIPIPLIGVRGIRFLAGRLAAWPRQLGAHQTALRLGQLIRMQEEIGTGGAGFRFIYAAFLQEAFRLAGDDRLRTCSEAMTATGDRWREFAAQAARWCKSRESEQETYQGLVDILLDCADREAAVYRELQLVLRAREL
jgi:hypothetical protein